MNTTTGSRFPQANVFGLVVFVNLLIGREAVRVR